MSHEICECIQNTANILYHKLLQNKFTTQIFCDYKLNSFTVFFSANNRRKFLLREYSNDDNAMVTRPNIFFLKIILYRLHLKTGFRRRVGTYVFLTKTQMDTKTDKAQTDIHTDLNTDSLKYRHTRHIQKDYTS